MGTHTRQPQGANWADAKRQPDKIASTNQTNLLAEIGERNAPAWHTSNCPGPPLGPAWAFLGRTVTSGPGGAGDFTDQRYWVEPLFINGGSGGGLLAFSTDTVNHDTHKYLVENLSERPASGTDPAGSHDLDPGTWVYVYAQHESSEQGDLKFFTFTGGGGRVPTGQYTGMFLGVIAADTVGYDYPFATNSV